MIGPRGWIVWTNLVVLVLATENVSLIDPPGSSISRERVRIWSYDAVVPHQWAVHICRLCSRGTFCHSPQGLSRCWNGAKQWTTACPWTCPISGAHQVVVSMSIFPRPLPPGLEFTAEKHVWLRECAKIWEYGGGVKVSEIKEARGGMIGQGIAAEDGDLHHQERSLYPPDSYHPRSSPRYCQLQCTVAIVPMLW